jgi:hypothetical protein
VNEVIEALRERGYKAFPVSALTGRGLDDVRKALLREFFDESRN